LVFFVFSLFLCLSCNSLDISNSARVDRPRPVNLYCNPLFVFWSEALKRYISILQPHPKLGYCNRLTSRLESMRLPVFRRFFCPISPVLAQKKPGSLFISRLSALPPPSFVFRSFETGFNVPDPFSAVPLATLLSASCIGMEFVFLPCLFRCCDILSCEFSPFFCHFGGGPCPYVQSFFTIL